VVLMMSFNIPLKEFENKYKREKNARAKIRLQICGGLIIFIVVLLVKWILFPENKHPRILQFLLLVPL